MTWYDDAPIVVTAPDARVVVPVPPNVPDCQSRLLVTVAVPDRVPPVRARLANDEPASVVSVPPETDILPAPLTVSDAVPPPNSTSAPALSVTEPVDDAPADMRRWP